MTVTQTAARTASNRRRLPWGVSLWLVLLAVFSVLALLAGFFDRLPGDEQLTDAFQSVNVPVLGGALDFSNLVGATWVYPPLTLGIAAALAFAGARWEAVLVLATLIPRMLNGMVKGLVERPRPSPELVEVSHEAGGYGFPSGHTLGTAVLFGLLFFLIPAAVHWRPLRWTLQAVCVLFVLTAGPARVYIGVHWPSDVIGGYVFALLFLLPAVAIYRAFRTPSVHTPP